MSTTYKEKLNQWSLEAIRLLQENGGKRKVKKIQTEIESGEVKKICSKDERKELYRKNLLELVKLLIEEIDK